MDISIFQSGSKSISEVIVEGLGNFLTRYKEKEFASFRLDSSDFENCTVEVSQHLSAYADDVDDLSEVIKVDLDKRLNYISFGYEYDLNETTSEVSIVMTFDQVKFLSELLVKEIDKAEKIMEIKNT